LIEPDSERRRRFDALFGDHVASIASYCRWRASSDHEDAVAEVFLIAWRRLDDVPTGKTTRAWLYAVARRVLANQARAEARRQSLSARLGAQPTPVAREEPPLAVHVSEALAALTPRDREVLLLAEWEGLTPTEIATVMRCPLVTARGRLHRARRRFRAAFDAPHPTTDFAFDESVSATLRSCQP
jgi:RNA polymerase sigma factor (sigma-70 family)